MYLDIHGVIQLAIKPGIAKEGRAHKEWNL
jgi:hypothetical protein